MQPKYLPSGYSLKLSYYSRTVVVNFVVRPKLQLQYALFTKHVVSYGCQTSCKAKPPMFVYVSDGQNLWECTNMLRFNKSSAIFSQKLL